MPIRGESVGTAYVRILGDGSSLPDDVRDALERAEPAIRAEGERQGEVYEKAFSKEMKGKSGKSLANSLERAIGRSDATEAFFGGDNWDEFVGELEERFGEAGRVAAKELEDGFTKQGNLRGIKSSIENIFPEIDKAVRKITAAEKEWEAQWRKDTDAIIKQTDKMVNQTTAELNRWNNTTNHVFRTVRTSYHEMATSYDKDSAFLRRAIKGTVHDFDSFAEGLGGIFGRGSRNNFLNFFGSIVTNVLRFGGIIVSVMGGVVRSVGSVIDVVRQFGTTFSKNMAQGEGVVASFAAAVGELAAMIAGSGGLALIPILIGLVGAMVLVAATAGTLVSALLLLGGVITALAATIAFALGGALGVATAALIPFAALILGTIDVIAKLNKATGPLKDTFDGIKKSFKSLRKDFETEALKDVGKQAETIEKSLGKLSPLAEAAGKGFRRAVNQLLAGLNDPAFDAFIAKFSKFLPGLMADIGSITGNLGGAFAGVATAALPITQDFFDYLDQQTARFSAWANSIAGQKSLTQFFEDAKESARALWDFIREGGGLVKDLLSAGKGEGDSIFTNMANGLERVRNYLKENPEALKNFFTDAKTFADDLGTAISAIVFAIDAIDSPATRAAAGWFIKALATWIATSALVLGSMVDLGIGTVKVFQAILEGALKAVKAIIDAFAKIPGPAGRAARSIQSAFDEKSEAASKSLDGIVDSMEEIKRTAAGLNPKIDIDITPAMSKLQTLQAAIGSIKIPASIAAPGYKGPTTPPTSNQRSSVRGGGAVVQRQVNIENINVTSPNNSEAVAQETINRLVATGY